MTPLPYHVGCCAKASRCFWREKNPSQASYWCLTGEGSSNSSLDSTMFNSRTSNAIPRLVRLNSTKTQPSSLHGVPSASPMPSKSRPPAVPALPQALNRAETWSTMQRPRPTGASSPLFEQTDMSFQPMPLSAMQLVSEDPIVLIKARKAVCDGGTPLRC